jgi:hypothetical protein
MEFITEFRKVYHWTEPADFTFLPSQFQVSYMVFTFPAKISNVFLISVTDAICPTSLILLYLITLAMVSEKHEL